MCQSYPITNCLSWDLGRLQKCLKESTKIQDRCMLWKLQTFQVKQVRVFHLNCCEKYLLSKNWDKWTIQILLNSFSLCLQLTKFTCFLSFATETYCNWSIAGLISLELLVKIITNHQCWKCIFDRFWVVCMLATAAESCIGIWSPKTSCRDRMDNSKLQTLVWPELSQFR